MDSEAPADLDTCRSAQAAAFVARRRRAMIEAHPRRRGCIPPVDGASASLGERLASSSDMVT
jgi:hypothetical protein